MTGLLSAISGQFTRSLVLGALFPAALFVLMWLAAVAPLLPPGFVLPAPRVFGKEWDALSITSATLVLAAMLYNLATPLIQLYEGYPWKGSLLGRWRTRVHRERLRTELRRAAAIYALTAGGAKTTESRRLASERSAIRRRLAGDYPDREDLVLPTRLGNVLRAFERYPSVQYHMDAIYLWPRMAAVIPGDYATAIGDARTSLVFLLNLSFLSAVLSVTTLAAGLLYLPPGFGARAAAPAAAFALLSRWFYTRALGPARRWGEVVKGAFDLYRRALLEQLGFTQTPRTLKDERALWHQVTQQIMYGDRQVDTRRSEPRLVYADPPAPAPRPRTWARGEPGDLPLEVARGVAGAGRDGTRDVVVEVRNPDPARAAAGVVVTDALPAGTEYVWSSARVNGQPVRVSGTNPYEFHLGGLASGAAAVLTYSALAAETNQGG